MSEARSAPHSIEAEQSVLGGLLLRNEAWYDLAGRLSAEDFYREEHRLLFGAIGELINGGHPCDLVTLKDHLERKDLLDKVGGLAYLVNLTEETPAGANVLTYADIVREHSVLRNLIRAGQQVAELGFRPQGRPVSSLIDEAEQQVFAIRETQDRGAGEFHHIRDVLDGVERRIETLRANPGALAGLSTGFVDLDHKTNGLHPGQLIIVAGRPGMGKTSFAMNIAEHVAIVGKTPVAVFSMEMSAEELALRVLSSFGRIDQGRLRSGQLEDRDWDRLVSASRLIREAPLFIDETGALSPFELRARARRLVRRHDVKLIVVDYIQLMQGNGRADNRTAEISEISRSLKALAKELKVPVIALSQLSREVERRENKRPLMSDLRESGSIEQDADLILFIYRSAYYKRKDGVEPPPEEDNTAEVIIAKQRSGPTGVVRTAFLGRYTRFDNLEYRDFGARN